MSDSPVERIATDPPDDELDPGSALCLSGGGYRAMLFHVGALWRLYEAGLLKNLNRVSSVSGGSITAGVLALAWKRLSFDPAHIKRDFVPLVVAPIRGLADVTIDADSIISGAIHRGRISDRIADAYDEFLFRGASLQALPDSPRFVINATNVQSGALWRFSKPYMRDYLVGSIADPKVKLAVAVAASSAFPPVLSPLELRLNTADFEPGSGGGLQRKPYTSRVFLTDGGVYDNLGLETAWKRYKTVYVSDGGGKMAPEPEPKSDWARHSYRVLNLVDNQVRALRKRQVIQGFKAKQREGTYWGIRTNIADYGLADALDCPFARSTDLAETPTRLKRLDDERQERLINWGYAVSDAAIRRHFASPPPRPADFPYPHAKV